MSYHMWIFGDLRDDFATGDEIARYLIEICGCFRLHLAGLRQCVLLVTRQETKPLLASCFFASSYIIVTSCMKN